MVTRENCDEMLTMSRFKSSTLQAPEQHALGSRIAAAYSTACSCLTMAVALSAVGCATPPALSTTEARPVLTPTRSPTDERRSAPVAAAEPRAPSPGRDSAPLALATPYELPGSETASPLLEPEPEPKAMLLVPAGPFLMGADAGGEQDE